MGWFWEEMLKILASEFRTSCESRHFEPAQTLALSSSSNPSGTSRVFLCLKQRNFDNRIDLMIPALRLAGGISLCSVSIEEVG